MQKRTVLLYWGLLLIPTILIGIAGAKLLSSEQERWDQMERSTALERARSIAQTIQVTIEGIEHEITDGLIAIPQEFLLETLLRWEKENPSIRNVFVWQPKVGLRYPSAGESLSSEQMRFVVRYQTLFVGRTSWLSDDLSDRTDLSSSPKTGNEKDKASPPGDQVYGGRLLQKPPPRLSERQTSQPRKTEPEVKHGWTPWYSDNRLHLLGWVQHGTWDVVYGVELETVSLVSRLIEQFPRDETEGIVYALTDDAGRLIHQLGHRQIQSDMLPDLEVSLTPHLAHWRVVVYLDPQGAALRSGNAFLIITGLLLATLMMTIVLGGVLLTRQAYSQWRDAQQKSSFVSNVSHELKTPLTTIRMYAELLNEGMVKDPEKKRHYLAVIVSETERLTRLVNNVLGFSRLEQGRMKHHVQDLDVVDFMHSFVDTNEIRVRESGMSLSMRIPERQVFVSADQDALKHTFLNILDNAVKYASGGSALEIEISVKGFMCEIRFMDNGPGIPASHREKIFEKFQRVDNSLTAGKAGTGLGLTIARHMMRDVGGDLAYEPREQGGSCFVVTVLLAIAKKSKQV